MNLLFGAFWFDRPLPEVCRNALPYLFVLLVALMLVIYVPGLIIGVGGN